ncbi:hypothetical protein [Thioclava sp. GXIMD2076]|uniref:Lipoprotein n=1 Tax=Thioclava kandeliae TaxID=3070818 RepID=A0ABV1SI87_9RHOB
MSGMIQWKPIVGVMMLGAVAACTNPTGQVQSAMPDREILSFSSQSGGKLAYACSKGADERETRARAQKAHQAYEHEIASYGPVFAKTLISVLKAGVSSGGSLEASVNRKSDEWARSAALTVERQYRCLPIGPA